MVHICLANDSFILLGYCIYGHGVSPTVLGVTSPHLQRVGVGPGSPCTAPNRCVIPPSQSTASAYTSTTNYRRSCPPLRLHEVPARTANRHLVISLSQINDDVRQTTVNIPSGLRHPRFPWKSSP